MLTPILEPVKTQNPGRLAAVYGASLPPDCVPADVASACPRYLGWLEASSRCHQDRMQSEKHKLLYFHP